MTEPAPPPGPVGDAPWEVDDPPVSRQATGHASVVRHLLRASLILLIASTAVMFLAAIAANSAVPSSTQERLALGAHRTSMFAMLLGFAGILLAVRLPMLSAYLSGRRARRTAAGLPPNILSAELRGLLLASAVLLAWVWGTALYGESRLHLITYWLLIIIAALLANMIIIHTGALRSFAVGMLMALLLILFTWRFLGTIAILYGDDFEIGFGGPKSATGYRAFGIEITISVIAGLVSAYYYDFVAKKRARSADAPAELQSH